MAAGNREITTPSASDVPTISGTDKFSDRTEVTITATPGAIIYYTTDGTVPTNGSQQYNTPITLTETTTIQAIAIEDGHIMSDVVGMTFTKESSGGSSSDGGTSGGSSSGSSSDSGSSSGSSSDSGSSSGSSSSGGSTDSGSETAPPQEETIQFDVSIRPNDSATVYVMQVTSLADTDRMSYQYSINGTDYYSL